MDEGLFWGFVIMLLVLAVVPIGMRGQKWAILSFFGFILGLFLASTLGADGSITVAYAACSQFQTCFTPITNPDSLPETIVLILTIFCGVVAIGKAADQI